MLPRLTQSTLLDAGSCSMKFSCTGDGMIVLDRGFVASLVDSERLFLLSESTMEGAADLNTLKPSFSSASGLSFTAEACLFGGGEIDLSRDDRNAS